MYLCVCLCVSVCVSVCECVSVSVSVSVASQCPGGSVGKPEVAAKVWRQDVPESSHHGVGARSGRNSSGRAPQTQLHKTCRGRDNPPFLRRTVFLPPCQLTEATVLLGGKRVNEAFFKQGSGSGRLTAPWVGSRLQAARGWLQHSYQTHILEPSPGWEPGPGW